jgi:hypothetical protein
MFYKLAEWTLEAVYALAFLACVVWVALWMIGAIV